MAFQDIFPFIYLGLLLLFPAFLLAGISLMKRRKVLGWTVIILGLIAPGVYAGTIFYDIVTRPAPSELPDRANASVERELMDRFRAGPSTLEIFLERPQVTRGEQLLDFAGIMNSEPKEISYTLSFTCLDTPSQDCAMVCAHHEEDCSGDDRLVMLYETREFPLGPVEVRIHPFILKAGEDILPGQYTFRISGIYENGTAFAVEDLHVEVVEN